MQIHKEEVGINMASKLTHYYYLLTLSYNEAVRFLLNKYGPGKDDYFKEKSYDRFLRKEIKSIGTGNYSRTPEGLYCHHIAENEFANLSQTSWILSYQYSFELQKKEQLVYCDLFEHLILHALIAKETNGNYGIAGYHSDLYPMIVDWYIGRVKPQKKAWMLNCYERAFLDSDETKKLLIMINSILPRRCQKKGEIIYISPEEYQKQDLEKRMKWEQEEKRWREEQILVEEEKLKQRMKEFYHSYPNFEKMNIKFDTPRSKIISLLYELKYHGTFKNKKELDSSMKKFIKDELFEELHMAIFNKRSL